MKDFQSYLTESREGLWTVSTRTHGETPRSLGEFAEAELTAVMSTAVQKAMDEQRRRHPGLPALPDGLEEALEGTKQTKVTSWHSEPAGLDPEEIERLIARPDPGDLVDYKTAQIELYATPEDVTVRVKTMLYAGTPGEPAFREEHLLEVKAEYIGSVAELKQRIAHEIKAKLAEADDTRRLIGLMKAIREIQMD